MAGKRQPQKAWGTVSWGQGAANAKPQRWDELCELKGTEKQGSQHLGWKEQVEAEGQDGPVLGVLT